MRVLHVAQPVDAGVPAYVRALAGDQATRGWNVTVAAPSNGDLVSWIEGRDDIAYTPWDATRDPGPRSVEEARRLRRIVRQVEPRIVHLHSAKAGLAGRLAIRRAWPTIYQPHSWSFNAAPRAIRTAAVAWERFGARWSDLTICVSETERQEGRAERIGGRIEVVHNGVDLEQWRVATDQEQQDAREALRLPQEPLAVCVGRLSRQKGQDLLLRAWRVVLTSVPAAHLALVGDGPDRGALQESAPRAVTLVGKRDDVARWLAAADLVVVPSRWEGLSLGLLEALARGRSIVTTDVAGAREAVGDEAGAVVPVEDEAALASAIIRRLTDDELRRREAAAARARAERFFDVRTTHDRIAALYHELIESHRSRGG